MAKNATTVDGDVAAAADPATAATRCTIYMTVIADVCSLVFVLFASSRSSDRSMLQPMADVRAAVVPCGSAARAMGQSSNRGSPDVVQARLKSHSINYR